jgi:ferredoxin
MGTILELAEKNGVALPSGCKVGECENCAVRVLKGESLNLSPSEFDDPERCLTCQSVPTSDLVLDA